MKRILVILACGALVVAALAATISTVPNVPAPASDTLIAIYTNNGSGSFGVARITPTNLVFKAVAAYDNSSRSNLLMGHNTAELLGISPDTIGAGKFNNTFASYSTALGVNAGQFALASDAVTLFGFDAGRFMTNGSYSTFIGGSAGMKATNAWNSVGLGYRAFGFSYQANQAVAIGANAARSASNANYTVVIGYDAGRNDQAGLHAATTFDIGESILIGAWSGLFLNGQSNVFAGFKSGQYASNTHASVLLGAFSSATNRNNAIAIGYGAYPTADNQTVIGNAATTAATIFGNVTASGSITATTDISVPNGRYLTVGGALLSSSVTGQLQMWGSGFGHFKALLIEDANNVNNIISNTSGSFVFSSATGQVNLVINGAVNPTNGVTWQGGASLTNVYYNSSTIDFPSTVAGAMSERTITVTGADSGDPVSLGVSSVSMPANGSYQAYVSAANTVTIRFVNNDLLTTYDPVSALFKVSVQKWK